MDLHNFERGDTVLIDAKEKGKQIIGKIEDIQAAKNEITYYVYYRPEETVGGRKPYHGKNEIFKTDQIAKDKLENIIRKVEILKTLDYLKKPNDLKNSNRVYIVRQFYDIRGKSFKPEIIDNNCLCEKVINPDEHITHCEGCEKLYHIECLRKEKIKFCPNCNFQFPSVLTGNTEGATIKLGEKEDQEFEVISKKQNTGLDESIISLIQRNRSKKDETKPAIKPTAPRSVPATSGVDSFSGPKSDPLRREFMNIELARSRWLSQAIEKMKEQNSARNRTEMQKKRDITVNLLTTYLLYGAEEIKEYFQQGNLSTKCENNREFDVRINSMQERDEIEFVRKKAIDIEATLFYHFHKDKANAVRPDSGYTSRTRVLTLNLKDDHNFELRYKVLSGTITSKMLATIDETELASQDVKKKKEAIERQYRKEHEAEEHEKIVIKNHKGEMSFELSENLTLEGQKLKEIPLVEQARLQKPFSEDVRNIPQKGLARVAKKQETPIKSNDPLRLLDADMRKQIEDNLYLNYKQKLRERFVNFLGEEESQHFLNQLDLV